MQGALRRRKGPPPPRPCMEALSKGIKRVLKLHSRALPAPAAEPARGRLLELARSLAGRQARGLSQRGAPPFGKYLNWLP